MTDQHLGRLVGTYGEDWDRIADEMGAAFSDMENVKPAFCLARWRSLQGLRQANMSSFRSSESFRSPSSRSIDGLNLPPDLQSRVSWILRSTSPAQNATSSSPSYPQSGLLTPTRSPKRRLPFSNPPFPAIDLRSRVDYILHRVRQEVRGISELAFYYSAKTLRFR